MSDRIVLDADAFARFASALERPPRRLPALIAAMERAGYEPTWPLYDSEGCYLERER